MLAVLRLEHTVSVCVCIYIYIRTAQLYLTSFRFRKIYSTFAYNGIFLVAPESSIEDLNTKKEKQPLKALTFLCEVIV